MGTSPDVGGARGLGRPQVQDYRELEQTAQAQVTKAGLGMVPNTIEVPFTQLGEQVWKYQANGNKPLLESNVFSGVTRQEHAKADPKEAQEFEKLMDEIPLGLSLELGQERRKPWSEREPSFIVFELILQFVAKARIWLDGVTEISSSLHSESIAKVEAYPHATLRGWIALTQEVIKAYQSTPALLKKTSVTNIKLNIEELLKIKRYLEASLHDTGEKREKIIAKLQEQLTTLKRQVEMKKIAGIFGVTKSLIDTLLPLIAALPRGKAVPTWEMFIFCYPTFIPGAAASKIFYSVPNTLPEAKFEETLFIPMITTAVTTLFTAITFVASGTRRLQARNDPRLEHFSVLTLAMRLASCLISNSNLLGIVASNLLVRAGIGVDMSKNMSAIMELFAYQGPLLSFSQEEDTRDAAAFMGGMERKICDALTIVKEFVGAKDPELSTAVRQADMALKKKAVQGYFEALQRALNPLHIRISTLQEEAAAWLQMILVWLKTMYEAGKQTNFTSVVSQIA